MSIYKRPNSKYWWISIYRGEGIPKLQVSSKTEDKAKAELMEKSISAAQKGQFEKELLFSTIESLIFNDMYPKIRLCDMWDACANYH